MAKTSTILVIDDQQDILFSLKFLLKQHFKSVFTESNPHRIEHILPQYQPDVILLDMNFGAGRDDGQEGLKWLKRIRGWRPQVPVITMTAYSDVDIAVRALKAGATDFIEKPWRNEKLVATVSTALDLSRAQRAVRDLQDTQRELSHAIDRPYQDIVGRSAAMISVYRTIDKVAGTDANVLVTGENGTGKELVARALHRKSRVQNGVFLPVDLSGIPDTDLSQELAGERYRVQEQTDEGRRGRMSAAAGGTLFLKEVESLSLPGQARLLEALQTRQMLPEPADAYRLVCAASRSLHAMVEEGLFRQDLLYQLHTVEIKLPPLRQRRGDIALLAGHFLEQSARKYDKRGLKLHAGAVQALEEYSWPGNVRELRHVIERAVLMCSGPVIQPQDLTFHPSEALHSDVVRLDEMERSMIAAALDKYGANISRAAAELGISRAALYRRIEKYGL
ncbi:MAG: sigma-54 dependent transcriptional regulator [Saprospiraceae bacterium]|nr:sigma-54 dependent transcriptional regulator [Saprospiraceae bacterium]